MIEKLGTDRINKRILQVISDLSWVQEKVAEFVENPGPELAQDLDSLFGQFTKNSEALRNSIITLAKEVTNTAIDENGEQEIDVVPDENGLRLM
jgi:hypothetical protein